jgi:hypothetical protein
MSSTQWIYISKSKYIHVWYPYSRSQRCLMVGDKVFRARETTSKYSKLREECNISV